MTMEEQRLSEILKRAVPEPPLELSPDRVTVRPASRPGRSWLMPAVAAAVTAAAVAVVAVVVAGPAGIAATHRSSRSTPSAQQASARQASAQQTRTIQVSLTAASGTAATTAPKSVVMPNVVGMSYAQAIAVLDAAGVAGNIGLTIQEFNAFNPAMPQGTVFKQYPAAGTAVRYTKKPASQRMSVQSPQVHLYVRAASG